MDEKETKVEQTNEHSDFRRAVIAIGFLVICILALTYGEYNMGKALNKAFDERQMLLDRVEILEQKVNSVAATGIENGWDEEGHVITDEHSPSMKDYAPEVDTVIQDDAENLEELVNQVESEKSE